MFSRLILLDLSETIMISIKAFSIMFDKDIRNWKFKYLVQLKLYTNFQLLKDKDDHLEINRMRKQKMIYQM